MNPTTPPLPADALARRLTEMARETAFQIDFDQPTSVAIAILQQFAEAVAAIVAQETREQEENLLVRYVECEDHAERDRLFLLLLAEKIESKVGVVMTWEIPSVVAATIRGIVLRRLTAIRAGAAPAQE